jgi:beta-N-acetylhexosaminidase
VTGACIFGCAGSVLEEQEAAFFRDANPWGFILFDRNLGRADEIRSLCAALREAVGWNAPILIDQEGGRVQRLRPPLVRGWRPALDFARAAGDAAPRAMYLRYRLIAHELLDLGIDVNCAPLGDLARPETHAVLLNRCYGDTAEGVAAAARAVADGHFDGGVLPVLKHIPGHGRARVDSHLDLPVVETDAEVLRETDFRPFEALSDLPLGMTCHLVFKPFDPEKPATTSQIMINLIRNEIGFDGLLMTDDLSMEALGGSIGDRAARARVAGCDVILHCNGTLSEMEAVATVAGTFSEASETRAARALSLRRPPSAIDIPAVEAELAALVAGGAYDRDR